jgi:hypothetical protein
VHKRYLKQTRIHEKTPVALSKHHFRHADPTTNGEPEKAKNAGRIHIRVGRGDGF